jgi:GH35 family endo-1,4-beta-xylanase
VKYVLVKDIDEKTKNTLKEKIKEDYELKIKELDVLYKEELESAKEKKDQKEIDKLFQENKEMLDKEFNRIKSIIADLNFSSTIMENDFRSIF